MVLMEKIVINAPSDEGVGGEITKHYSDKSAMDSSR